MPEAAEAAAACLLRATDTRALRDCLTEHAALLGDGDVAKRIKLAGLPAVDRARLLEAWATASSRGLVAAVQELVPLPATTWELVERFLKSDSWAAAWSLLKAETPLLTNTDVQAAMRAHSRAEPTYSSIAEDGLAACGIAGEHGLDEAKAWLYARLADRFANEPPLIRYFPLKSLLWIPLVEQTWDPMTEEEWSALLQSYTAGVDVHVPFERGLAFVIELQQVTDWAPNATVAVILEKAELYLRRPPMVDSDRAHNVELAIAGCLNALKGIGLGHGRGYEVRAHTLLGRAYADRLQQDPIQSLRNAHTEFLRALELVDRGEADGDRGSVLRLAGSSMIQLARRSIAPTSRREALSTAITTLQDGSGVQSDVWRTADLADALALDAEFDPSHLADAISLVERLLTDTESRRPVFPRFVPVDSLGLHAADAEWAYVRHVYARIAQRCRAVDRSFPLARALAEIEDAEAFSSGFGVTGEQPSGTELRGDLLLYEERWSDALTAYLAIEEGELPYQPFSVLGQEARISSAARVDSKIAFCLAKLGRAGEAVLRADRSTTRRILGAMEWEDILSRMAPSSRRDKVLATVREVRSLEAAARVVSQALGAEPDTETGYLLIDARGRLFDLWEELSPEERGGKFALTESGVAAVVPTDGLLLVPLITPVGTAFITIRRQGEVHTRATYTGLTDDDGRRLLGRYLMVLQAVDQPLQGGDAAVLLDELLTNLSDGLAKDIRLAIRHAEIATGAAVRFVGHMGLGSLPLHASFDPETGRLLLEDFAFSSVPSVGLVAYRASLNREASHRGRALIIADPTGDLPFAKLEARLVADASTSNPPTVLAGSKAARDHIEREESVSRLHFVGHARADLAVPWQSALKIADGELTAADVSRLAAGDAPMELVVLSACETGFVDVTRAPGEYGGLNAAFVMAGATTVVSSLWPMLDFPSVILMSELYRILGPGDADDVADALRTAELWLRSADRSAVLDWIKRQEHDLSLRGRGNWAARWRLLQMRYILWMWRGTGNPFSHPYHWAGFVATAVGRS